MFFLITKCYQAKVFKRKEKKKTLEKYLCPVLSPIEKAKAKHKADTPPYLTHSKTDETKCY